MSIIDRILTILTPYECIGCSAEGKLLCTDCTKQLTTVPERCYKCRKPSALSRTCPGCAPSSNLYSARAATAYKGFAKTLVAKLKFGGAQAAAQEMADLLRPFVTGQSAVIVPVPTATGRVRRRGYDQSRLIARELSRKTGLPYLNCLARNGQTHQVGSSRTQRLKQLEQAFYIRRSISDQPVLLIDDVLTTGATLEMAAKALHIHGVSTVMALVFAQARA